MNWDQVARRWSEIRPDIASQWPKLTGDDLESVHGEMDVLVAKIEKRYGLLEETAREQVNEWLEKRSSKAEKRPFREAVIAAIAIPVLFMCLVRWPLPWGPGRYIGFAALIVALMAILFWRRRRLEF
jgi:uncharacterized protein YjbJ (UPF0337 family)